MRKSSLGILLLVILFTGIGETVAIAGSKEPTGPAHVLRFRQSDGWGAPGIKVSDNRLRLTIAFRTAPEKPMRSLDRILTERSRRIFSHVQVRQENNRTYVDLELSRPLHKMKRKKYLKKNWLVRVELKPSGVIEVPSYASMFPEGLERIVAEETERSLVEADPDCGGINVLREDTSSWTQYAELMYAECLQQDGKHKDARKAAKRLIRGASPQSPLGMLTALRINQWKGQKSYRVEITDITWSTLPAPVAQELGLRLAQRTYSRDLERAIGYFLGATSAGTLDPALETQGQSIRFDLLQRSIDAGLTSQSLSLANALPLPPAGHVSYKGTARACSLVWGTAGETKKALSSASVVLPKDEAILVDQALKYTLEQQKKVSVQEAHVGSEQRNLGVQTKQSARTLTPPIKNLALDPEASVDALGAILGIDIPKSTPENTPQASVFNTVSPKRPTVKMPKEVELALALQSKGSKQRVGHFGENHMSGALAITGGE